MRLSRRFDYALIALATISAVLVFACLCCSLRANTFAEGENSEVTTIKSSYFVTIYDNGEKLTVKTTAKTVSEILDKLKVTLNASDIVEPSLDAVVDSDNFFINIF